MHCKVEDTTKRETITLLLRCQIVKTTSCCNKSKINIQMLICMISQIYFYFYTFINLSTLFSAYSNIDITVLCRIIPQR